MLRNFPSREGITLPVRLSMLTHRFERLHKAEPPARGRADAADDLPLVVLKGGFHRQTL
jgi:hypothetical protein